MPYFFTRDFVGGIHNRVQERLIEDNQFTDLLNIDLTTPGKMTRRPGFESRHTAGSSIRGLSLGRYLDSAGTRRLMLIRDDYAICTHDDGTPTTTVVGTFSASTNRWWIVNGVASDGAGPPSNYEEVVFLSNGAEYLTWWTGSGTITQNSGMDNIKAMVWWRDRLWYTSGDTPYQLSWSRFRSGNNATADDSSGEGSVYVSEGDGDVIQALFPTRKRDGGELLICKTNSIHAANIVMDDWTGTAPAPDTSSYTRVVTTEVGVYAPHSPAWVGDDLFFLDRTGVRSLARAEDDTLTTGGLPVSLPIQTTIDRINWAQVDKCVGTAYGDKYYLTVPLDSATDPDYVLIYDVRNGGWTIYDWPAAQIFGDEPSGVPYIYFAVSSGASDTATLARVTPSTFTDGVSASDIECTIDTKAFDLGSPHFNKQWWWLEFSYTSSAREDMTIYTRLDNGNWDELITIALESTTSLSLEFSLPAKLSPTRIYRRKFDLGTREPSRDIQFRFSFTGSADVEIFDYSLRYEEEGEYEETNL